MVKDVEDKIQEEKNNMKDNKNVIKQMIIIFAVGILFGAIVSTGSFLTVYAVTNHSNDNMQFQDKSQFNMPDRQFGGENETNGHSKKTIDNNAIEKSSEQS